MKPFQEEGDSEEAKLLSQIAPLARSEARQERVWLRLEATGPARRLGSGFRLRPVWAALGLLGLTAVAGATFGRGLIERIFPARRIDPMPSPIAGSHRAPPRTGVRSEPTPPLPMPLPMPSVPAIATEPQPPRAVAHRPRPIRNADPAAVVRTAPATLETQLLLDAVNALRRDHDPARAHMLLQFHRSRYPNGALVEEALVLAIEAAGDAKEAEALRQRYHQRYPNGHFLPVVGR